MKEKEEVFISVDAFDEPIPERKKHRVECVYVSSGRYASDVPELQESKKLPTGFINKTECGVGFTSFAIETELCNTVIAMPTIKPIRLKHYKYKDGKNSRYPYEVLAVEAGVTINDIDDFITKCKRENRAYKILTTYDSLPKITNHQKDFHLVIDEWQIIVSWSALKSESKGVNKDNYPTSDVITNLLNIAEEYKDSVTFITATPISLDYLAGNWLDELHVHTFLWENYPKSKPIIAIENSNPILLVREAFINKVDQQGEIKFENNTYRKLIIYVNSVSSIVNLVNGLPNSHQKCAIMCADSIENDEKIKDVMPRFSNENIANLPIFTFITSTGWQALDLYDKDALSIVISHSSQTYTIVDTQVQLKQIFGRQRDVANPSYGTGLFIYNKPFKLPDLQENLKIINQTKEQYLNNVEMLNEMLMLENDYFLNTSKTFRESSEFCTWTHYRNHSFELNKQYYLSCLYENQVIQGNYADKEKGIIFYKEAISFNSKLKKIKTGNLGWSKISTKYFNSLKDQEEVIWTEEERSCKNYKIIDILCRCCPNLVEPPATCNQAKLLIKNSQDNLFRTLFKQKIRSGTEHNATDWAEIVNNIKIEVGLEPNSTNRSVANELYALFSKTSVRKRILDGRPIYVVIYK